MAHPNAWNAVGEASEGLGRALMQVMSISEGRINRAYDLKRQGMLDDRAARRLAMDEDRYEREKVNEQRVLRENAESRTLDRLDRWRADTDIGWSAPRDLDITHPAMSTVQPGMEMPGTMGSAPTTMAGSLTEVAQPREQRATFDPTQGLAYQTREAELAQTRASNVSQRRDYMDAGLTGTGQPPNLSRFESSTGMMNYNPVTGTADPLMRNGVQVQGPSSGGIGIQDMPVTAQNAITAISATKGSITNYGQMAGAYMDRGAASRGLANLGFADAAQDAEMGALIAAQNTVMLNLKELAGLGVLNGPDMGLLLNMIGDPMSLGSLIRDPSYVTGRIPEVLKFIETKIDSYETNYGIDLSATRGDAGGGVPGPNPYRPQQQPAAPALPPPAPPVLEVNPPATVRRRY